MNETVTILHNTINEFSNDNLINLFRNKSSKFRPLNEDVNHLDNDFFVDSLLLGEFKVSPFGGDLEGADELVVYTFKTKKELTERSGKKAQYDLAKKILKQEQRYAAGFFIFYDENGNFRLSLIYDIPQPNGKREWSSFKRFTYYVSKDQTNKTFIYRIDTADFSSLEKIKEAFSVEKVTKEFYTEIANWYFWTLKFVKFPKDAETEKNGKNIALIRFITRIIFIWFMKQKKLIKNNLFNKNELKNILNSLSDKENTYYKAILQNLFFATLNTPIKERKFRKDHSFQGKKDHYMEHNYYRFHSLFNDPDDMLNIFKDIPFLNGGLFECLDKAKNDPSNDTGAEIRIDGFSDKEANQTIFPNFLFFSGEKEVDLNKDYGTAKKKYKTRGLLNILQSYNFTIDENTPTDEEIALDPELLGRVFENLLASYNPETASTARKSTGSYYTPREIVNYMVDESLIAYLKNKMIEGAKSYIQLGEQQSDMFGNSTRKGQLKIEEELLPSRWINKEEALEKELRKLISYSEEAIIFAEKEIDILINAINTCKILDPAVGSGAFPMGVLHKLVLILSKLDPHNLKWKQEQISGVTVTDPQIKNELIKKIEENFSRNELDYGRKLYLIQNCLYGVDIQPIAIQIAKLRFFISLLVDEKVQSESDNFGIEPLPNLETKLVAANTLIGLPQTLTLKPIEIEKLENKLFGLRRKYFITSSETEKKQLEANDRELRGKIKAELKEKDFPAEYAEKISGWDPYNTNISSSWFDPEWMFGPDVKNGFDVVIGNPPYVSLSQLPNETINDLKQQHYETFSKNADIYCLFYEKGMDLLHNSGILAYITSNRFCFTNYGIGLRKYLSKKDILKLINFNELNVFESANVGSIVTFIRNKNSADNNIFINEVKGQLDFDIITSGGRNVERSFYNESQWSFDTNNAQNLKQKIESKGIPFNKLKRLKINRGITTGANDIFIIDEVKRNKLIKEDPKSEEIIVPILRGANIKRYMLNKPEQYLIYTYTDIKIKNYPAVYRYLMEHKTELENVYEAKHKQKKWYELRKCNYYDKFSMKKLVWTRLSNQNAFAISFNGEYTIDSSSFAVGDNIEYLAAILNSKLILFYFKLGSVIWGKDGIKWFGKYFDNIPIPIIDQEKQKPLTEIVDQILSAKQQNPQVDTKHLEDRIDIMVYKLYNLTYEEVEIIDPQIGSIINKEDYEKFELK